VEDTIQGKQDSLTAGTNISIVDDVVSCDLTGSTNIDITDGVISTTGLQEELSAGTNISIVDNEVSCDLTGSTNIDITSGVISTTGLQNELTGGTNISIVDDVVSCDLTGSTNIDITGGVISTSTVLDGVISQNGDDILSNTNNLTSVQTQVDSLIDIFSQGISFRAYSLSSATISSGQNLPFNNESYDSQGTYDTTTYVYTIDIAGTYLFTFGWNVVSESQAIINLIRKRSGTEVIIQQSFNGTATGDNTSFYVATIDECESGDEIYAKINSGSCRLAISDLTEPNNNTSFSGSRLSS